MTSVCPNGHPSSADDYCDVCGVPLAGGATAPGEEQAAPSGAPAAAPDLEPCPSCDTPHTPDALFCESCGYDFTTGSMPRPLDPPDVPAAGSEPMVGGGASPGAAAQPYADLQSTPDPTSPPPPRWVVEVWIDPAWYTAQQSPDPLPSAGPPQTVVLGGRSALVGRVSKSRNIHPEVDCGADSGVSRRHAQLTTDGSRWWVEDLESANGTFVAPASASLPEDPIPVGEKRELGRDDRVYVGAWTRLVVRPATGAEQG